LFPGRQIGLGVTQLDELFAKRPGAMRRLKADLGIPVYRSHFGMIINADVVHAFSPQTIITDAKYLGNKEQIRYVHHNYAHQFLDLGKVIKSAVTRVSFIFILIVQMY